MTSCLILTAADAKFFQLAQATILSLRQKPQSKRISIGFFDLGCTPEQRQWLAAHVDLIQEPGWDFEFPTRSTVPSYFRALLARPYLRRYFPNFDVYLWIDADAWLQEWGAVDLLIRGALKRGLAIVPEVDRGNLLLYGRIEQSPKDMGYQLYQHIFGEEVAERLHSFPRMNAGVFALHREAPHWEKWIEFLHQGLQSYASLWTDQMALNRVIYEGELFERTELLPAWCNWTCHYGLPAWDPERQMFVEPYLPHTPIGILHMTASSKDQHLFPITSTQGGIIEMDIHFPLDSVGIEPQRYDYVSLGFEHVTADPFFPNMILGDVEACPWTYLRREIPHRWYVDRRVPSVGFVSRDEAHILYNTALQFSGKRALEIGCWMGWSACHLALAGVQLDIIDPRLSDRMFFDSVSQSLGAAGVLSSVTLNPGFSPAAVEDLYGTQGQKWSLIFIDGDHDRPGPLQDAMIAETVAEPDAMILFHDLSSPDVAEGLDYLRQQGWQTLIYQTMQIMGVAWRGQVQPVHHIPDPTVEWQLPDHLKGYAVSGLADPIEGRRWQTVLPQPILRSLHHGIQAYRYKNISMQKSPFDMALYTKLIGEIKPKTLIEIGSLGGGSAIWFADLLTTYGIEGHVYSIDVHRIADGDHPQVTYLEGSGQHLEDVLPADWLTRLPRPLLVIEDADRSYTTTAGVLTFFDSHLLPGEYMVIEGAIIEDLGYPLPAHHDGGPNRAIREFLRSHSGSYRLDTSYCDYYGHNVTWNANGYLKKERDLSIDRDQEFMDLLNEVRSYSLLSLPRLYSLFTLAKQICQQDIPGDFVECGVYKGGAAALLATVIKRYSSVPRKVFAFDTFEGMPDPTDRDHHEGIPANQTRFGAGTLKAPIAQNLEQIGRQLGVWDLIVPVQGLFEATLPHYRDQIESIALLHADGDWYQSTLEIFVNLYDRVVEEGYVQIDDYGHWQGCKQAIHDFERRIGQFFVLRSIDYTGVWLQRSQVIPFVRELGSAAEPEAIVLNPIHLVLFPDWSQDEDQLVADLEHILRTIVDHPEAEAISLTLSADLDYGLAESLLTAAATNLSFYLLEQGLEVSVEPQINVIKRLNPDQWLTLLERSTGRLRLTHEQWPAGIRAAIAELPAYAPDQISPLHSRSSRDTPIGG